MNITEEENENSRKWRETRLSTVQQTARAFISSLEIEEDESLDLENSPRRVAALWVKELTRGYERGGREKLIKEFTCFATNEIGHNMVIVRDIAFSSTCAHHLLPFVGRFHVAYLPNQKMAGLSKFARVVEFFSKKLQTQERLTNEIHKFLSEQLETNNVAVISKASHSCMTIRGIAKPESTTVVSAVNGRFQDHHVKQEFMTLLSL